MSNVNLTPEKIKKRLEQAGEMEQIWDGNSELAKAFLKGCIATANALAGKYIPEDKKVS